jgi:hypothetical protein
VAERTLGVPIKVLEVGGHVTTCIVRPHRLVAVYAPKVDIGAVLLAPHLKGIIDCHKLTVERASDCERHRFILLRMAWWVGQSAYHTRARLDVCGLATGIVGGVFQRIEPRAKIRGHYPNGPEKHSKRDAWKQAAQDNNPVRMNEADRNLRKRRQK